MGAEDDWENDGDRPPLSPAFSTPPRALPPSPIDDDEDEQEARNASRLTAAALRVAELEGQRDAALLRCRELELEVANASCRASDAEQINAERDGDGDKTRAEAAAAQGEVQRLKAELEALRERSAAPLRAYRREREALESERDEAAQSAAAYKQLAEKAAENAASARARAEAATARERDATGLVEEAASARDAAFQERDTAVRYRDQAQRDRDAAASARDEAIRERDAAANGLAEGKRLWDEAVAERDAASAARDEAEQEAARCAEALQAMGQRFEEAAKKAAQFLEARSGRRPASKPSSRRPRGPRTTPRRRGAPSRRTSASRLRPETLLRGGARETVQDRDMLCRLSGWMRSRRSQQPEPTATRARGAARCIGSIVTPAPPRHPRQKPAAPRGASVDDAACVWFATRLPRLSALPRARAPASRRNGCSICNPISSIPRNRYAADATTQTNFSAVEQPAFVRPHGSKNNHANKPR